MTTEDMVSDSLLTLEASLDQKYKAALRIADMHSDDITMVKMYLDTLGIDVDGLRTARTARLAHSGAVTGAPGVPGADPVHGQPPSSQDGVGPRRRATARHAMITGSKI